jgi:hypothetical protein
LTGRMPQGYQATDVRTTRRKQASRLPGDVHPSNAIEQLRPERASDRRQQIETGERLPALPRRF